jgi:hypothetical protein
MSDPSDRFAAKTARRISEELEAVERQLIDLELERAKIANQLDALKYQWRLTGIAVQPGQRPDSVLREGWWTNYVTKGSEMGRHFGRTTRLTRAGTSVIAEAVIDCAGPVDKLRRAFGRLGEADLNQMGRVDLPRAGRVLSATVGDDGRVTVKALITDAAAVTKAIGAVYSGLLIELADDEVDGVSLIDTPYGFAKGSGGLVIAKVFARRGASEVKKPVAVYSKKFLKLRKRQRRAALGERFGKAAVASAIAPSAQAAIAEIERAGEAYASGAGRPAGGEGGARPGNGRGQIGTVQAFVAGDTGCAELCGRPFGAALRWRWVWLRLRCRVLL